jgi:hypothetical protein
MDLKTQYCQDGGSAYTVHEIPIKILESYFVDLNKLILKFILRCKTRLRVANRKGKITLHPSQHINSKWITDLNNEHKTIMLLKHRRKSR